MRTHAALPLGACVALFWAQVMSAENRPTNLVIAGLEQQLLRAGRDHAELLARASDVAGERAANSVLTAEIEAERKDAERYRWMRDGEMDHTPSVRVREWRQIGSLYGDRLDAAIDAEMAANKEPTP